MVRTGASVEWTVVATEVEALQLEYSWIKEFDPRFNVKYRDDKSYPFLAVTLGEEFPRAQVMRGAKRKGTRYFGPFSHAWAIRETLDLLLRVFPMRTCSTGVFKRAHQSGRPCLLGYIDKCSAPCVGRVDPEEHRQIAEDFCDFMAGNTTKFTKRVERQMRAASDAMEYELAARLRDDLGALHKALEKNAVVLADKTDADVFALADDELEAAVQVFFVRGGRIRGQRGWVVEKESEDVPELMGHLLQQVYGDQAQDSPDQVPREVLVPIVPAESEALAIWLGTLRGHRVDLRVPQRGDKRALMETVRRNAEQSLARHKVARAGDLTTRSQALQELQDALELPDAPLRIECFDVSHVQGTNVVASMVVFEDGAAAQVGVPPVRRPGRLRAYRARRHPDRRRHRGHARGADPPVPALPRRARALGRDRHGSGHRGRRRYAAGPRPDRRGHRPSAQVRLPAQPRRRRRRAAAGERREERPRRARHRGRVAGRPGQAAGGGLGARPGLPAHPAADQRGALPAAARARRGAPVRHHLPPAAAVARR